MRLISNAIRAMATGAVKCVRVAAHFVRRTSSFRVHHGNQPRHVARVDVHDPTGVHRRAAPFRATVEAGSQQRAFAARWLKRYVRTQAREVLQRFAMRGRSARGEIGVTDTLTAEWRRLQRQRLGGRRDFTRDVGRGDGDVLDREERFAGFAVKDKDVS